MLQLLTLRKGIKVQLAFSTFVRYTSSAIIIRLFFKANSTISSIFLLVNIWLVGLPGFTTIIALGLHTDTPLSMAL